MDLGKTEFFMRGDIFSRCSPGARLRRRLLGIGLAETSLARRGFQCDDAGTRSRLEAIGRVFLTGYHAAVEEDTLEGLFPRLEAVAPEDRGFAYEGAGMGLALRCLLQPWRWRQVGSFLDRASAHSYMVHIGLGWAMAAVPIPVGPLLRRFDPLLRWLLVDGFGFYHGYFAPTRHLEQQQVPARLTGYARRVFDQGLGRALWFAQGGDVARITRTIAVFPERRRPDLWSGIGLACAYAGGVDEAAIRRLRAAEGADLAHLAQGASFAAKARQRAGTPAPHTERACVVLCGMSGDEAARVTDEALVCLPAATAEAHEAYEAWRGRIRARFSEESRLG